MSACALWTCLPGHQTKSRNFTATANIRNVGAPMAVETGIPDVASALTAIRVILARHGRLSLDVNSLQDHSDLYNAGLTSLATVNIMLALENHFDIEFADSMLSRKTFASVASIAEAVASLVG
jgi:acyl carrier protein